MCRLRARVCVYAYVCAHTHTCMCLCLWYDVQVYVDSANFSALSHTLLHLTFFTFSVYLFSILYSSPTHITTFSLTYTHACMYALPCLKLVYNMMLHLAFRFVLSPCVYRQFINVQMDTKRRQIVDGTL